MLTDISPDTEIHASLRGGNNIVRLADAKIVAWSMYPAVLLPNILSERNIVGVGESKEIWFTQSR
jgi:hypothetical protein